MLKILIDRPHYTGGYSSRRLTWIKE
jgi:hypothetical protein